MEIRIGNDVRLNFTLNNVSFYIEDIRFAKAFLINTTMQNVWKEQQEYAKNHPHMHHCEPFPQFYDSTPYTTNACGSPTYYVYPSNCNCRCHKRNLFGWHNKPYEEFDKFTFEVPVRVLPRQDKIQAYFKAFNQVPGEYKVVMQYTVYEEGYGLDNLHTYTIDYGKLFELVYSETPDPKSIVVDIDSGKVIQDITYGPLMIETFTYGEEDLNHTGGLFTPILKYKQKKTILYSDGTISVEYIISGAKIEYSNTFLEEDVVLQDNGTLNVPKNTNFVKRKVASIQVDVSTTEQTGQIIGTSTKQLDVYQKSALGEFVHVAPKIIKLKSVQHSPMYVQVDSNTDWITEKKLF